MSHRLLLLPAHCMRLTPERFVLRAIVVAICFCAAQARCAIVLKPDGYHVYPGDNIQDALELAAKNATNKVVKVHAGQYRPSGKRQALVWFNRAHDGIRLEAVGDVTLTAANAELSRSNAPGYPAVVNHVVYFGDGVTSNTVLRGFRITGANNFVSNKLTKQMEPDETIPKNLFFYTDGGGIKIFGRSYPVIQNVVVADNYSSPCGAGISVQHKGHNQELVTIENCVFLRNRAQVTGSAIDLLEGSAARIVNCVFNANASNLGEDIVAKRSGECAFTNSGVLTVFQNSRALVKNCTFVGNRNAVDDLGGLSTYQACIFAEDNLATGLPAERYELDLPLGANVENCVFRGPVRDPRNSVSEKTNVLGGPPPRFDETFVPGEPAYSGFGYRPAR
ncbi:MAG TPA: right-handed parallel beta-helix repeat-containing protein [Verrucomicrobiae bacterium]|nr:right-handed parallel beta-helix repeat-containing protein [Verrucomicrobiae bacterium]